MPNKIPLATYIIVIRIPKVPINIATAISFTKGEVIK